jgi:hypothetical protein
MSLKWTYIPLIAMAIAASGCASSPSAVTASAPSQAAAQPVAANVPTPGPAPSDNGFPTIPPGAVYTLWCMTINTPTNVPDSDRLKQELIQKTSSNDWYVIHGDGQSTLYYGFYKTFDDKNNPDEVARAQADRRMIAGLRDDSGDTPFGKCAFVSLASPDPDAPPDWDLRNAPGYWSLQIAAYRGSPDRKKFAVDAVRQARAMGIQAYYYHGPAVSCVFIGTWPREAVHEDNPDGAKQQDPNSTLVVPSQPLPPGASTDNLHMPDGRPIEVAAPKAEVVDPNLIATMRQYPENAVNGQVTMHRVMTPTGEKEIPDPSFLVVIPHDQAVP